MAGHSDGVSQWTTTGQQLVALTQHRDDNHGQQRLWDELFQLAVLDRRARAYRLCGVVAAINVVGLACALFAFGAVGWTPANLIVRPFAYRSRVLLA